MSGNEEKLWNADYLKIWTLNFLVHFSFTLIVPLLPLYLTTTYGASRDTVGMVLAGYSAAFWVAFAINAVGVAFYFISIHSHFERNKLR